MKVRKSVARSAAPVSDLDVGMPAVVDALEEELVVIGTDYRILFANLSLRRRFQRDSGGLVGRFCYDALHGRSQPCEAPPWDCPLAMVLESGSPTSMSYREPLPDGSALSERHLKIMISPLRDSAGNIEAIVELTKDVTSERHLEEQFQRRYQKLLAVSRISAALAQSWKLAEILRVGLDSVLQLVNGTSGGIMLLDEETQTLSYRVHRGVSARYAQKMRLRVGEGIAGRVAQTGEPFLSEDISLDSQAAYPALVSAEGLKAFVSVPLRAKGRILGVINVASDRPRRFSEGDMLFLTSIGYELGVAIERARLYEELARGRETYRRLLRHALLAQEEERSRIARELHDETRQTLTGLALHLQALLTMAHMDEAEVGEMAPRIEKAHGLALQAGDEVRRIISDLRPAVLEELGLVTAIRRYAETHLKPQGIEVSVKADSSCHRLPPEVEMALFRIVQGAVSNIRQHSEAKNATIELVCNSKEILLRVEDDGKGFDVGSLPTPEEGGRGVGLFTMKERVSLVGGSLSIESQPGHGAKVTVKVPLFHDEVQAREGVPTADD